MADTPRTVSVNEANTPQPTSQPANQPTSQQTSQQTSQSNSEPQKKIYLSQNPKKEEQTFQGMTVAQKLNYLTVKEKRGILTPEERKQQEECKEQLLKEQEGDEGEITPEDGTKVGEKDEEPKDLFKEQDIIQYMYNEWLLGGANWLYKKTYKKIDQYYASFKNRCAQAKNDAKKHKNSDYNTITTRNNIDDKAVKLYDGQKATLDRGKNTLQAQLEAIKSGDTNAAQTALTQRLMQELPEGKRQQFCAQAQTMIENLSENLKTIHFVAGQLARAQMAESLCMNQDVFKNAVPSQIFEAMEKRNALAIGAQMDEWQKQGKNPAKFIQKLKDDVEKANKFADKQYKKNIFDEAGKKGQENKTLRNINKSLNIPEAEITKPQNREPQTMLQHLIVSNNLEMSLAEQLKKNTNRLNIEAARNDNYQSRRENFHARMANYSNAIRSRTNPRGYFAGDRKGQLQPGQSVGSPASFKLDTYHLAQRQMGATK